jgi:hypothetical protein
VRVATFGAALLLDNAILVESRLILVYSMLLLFGIGALLLPRVSASHRTGAGNPADRQRCRGWHGRQHQVDRSVGAAAEPRQADLHPRQQGNKLPTFRSRVFPDFANIVWVLTSSI